MKKRAQKKVKHKPNARHTLSEVLHSLQDIVNNELSNITEKDGVGLKPNTTPPLSKEDVMNSLRELIGDVAEVSHTLEPVSSPDNSEDASLEAESTAGGLENPMPDEESFDEALSLEQISSDNSMDEAVAELDGLAVNTDNEPDEAPAENDADNTPAPAEEFKLEIEDPNAHENRAVKNSRADDLENIEPINTDITKATSIGVQSEINWDDIPVLNEVVAPPPEPDHTTSQEAREIAIKVSAALNIESRKKGGGSIDIKTIMRLQKLLSQELQDRQGEDDEK